MKYSFPLCIVAIAFSIRVIAYASYALAQQMPATAPNPPPLPKNSATGDNLAVNNRRLTEFFDSHTPYEFWLTCLIVGFGLAMVLVLIISMRKINARPEDVSRPIIVVTLIVASLILITAGYSNEQIAPAFGLFGTIVGYILGRLSRNEPLPPESNGQHTANADVTENAAIERRQP